MGEEKIVLKVSGTAYEGWTSVAVEKSLWQMAGSFGLSTTDVFPGQARKWDIAMGDECVLEINDQKVITGYIEDILVDYDEETDNIQFGGRDRTCDLVDCSYDETEKEWRGLSVAKIIEKLCDPFGIDVIIDDSVSSSADSIWDDSMKANEGDAVFDLILKICNMKGILPANYGDGNLTLTRAGSGYATNDILKSGKNIKRAFLNQSNKDRFQTYIVKGQGVGNDNKATLPIFTSPSKRVTDDVINRYRPIIIFTETPCDAGKCLERAKWEMNNRAGMSRFVDCIVQGWTQSNGEVWPLNAMTQIEDDKLGIHTSLLISSLNFEIRNRLGSITKMRLVHPDAFSVQPSTEKIKTGFDWMR